MIMIKENELRLLSKVPLLGDIEPFQTIKKGKFSLCMFCVSYIVSKAFRFADPDQQRRGAGSLTARIYRVYEDSVDAECPDYTVHFSYKDGRTMSDISIDEIREIVLDSLTREVGRLSVDLNDVLIELKNEKERSRKK